jgi:hypothetical protein
LQLVAEVLALQEAAEARALDRGDIDENVDSDILRLYEAMALLGVKPLYGTVRT